LKKLAAPLYSEAAVARRDRAAIEQRSSELEVPDITRRCSPPRIRFRCFCTTRKAATRVSCVSKTESTNERHRAGVHAEELATMARKSRQRFSPNVTLRAVVQDYLLPTIAYYGGAAEIAYFAQTAEVYRVLERPATPILPRSSLTMIERHTGRVLERYGPDARDFFRRTRTGYEARGRGASRR
jgi:uncharacterized protein YllA (UPF0747 family)